MKTIKSATLKKKSLVFKLKSTIFSTIFVKILFVYKRSAFGITFKSDLKISFLATAFASDGILTEFNNSSRLLSDFPNQCSIKSSSASKISASCIRNPLFSVKMPILNKYSPLFQLT
ncbi:269R [Invertebrate iridescent virus Kaz2018]|nr:269R [Invertebrate iridescent virus Kaz2018]